MDTIVADAAAIPRGSCCEDDKCAEASNDLYTCSLTYEDPEMAMSFCPQRKDSCGSTSEFQKDATSDAVSEVEITGMTTGESCSYKVKSCGASPAFKLKDSSTCDNKKVNITYLEFNEKKVNMTGGKLDKK